MSEIITTETTNEVHIKADKASDTKTAVWRDYYEITKPKVVALLVLTALVGMCLSVPGAIPWQVLVPVAI